ncbi:hypothetical protein, partial [Blautia hydrogenotrophica]|uniref:hypothetical protein n=1 Tax=Blautia hydrogenotrophica TaxID=53443 RepID=UPI0039999682
PYFSQLGKLPFFITSFLGLRGILESRFWRFWYCSMPLPFFASEKPCIARAFSRLTFHVTACFWA